MSAINAIAWPAAPAIHVVEDDAGLRAALEDLFHSVGYQTRLYGNTDEFVVAGAGQSPGCLVLDIRLPGLSGLDFQDQLRHGGVGMPIVLMSGHGDIPMTVRGMKAGAVDFLPKPFDDQDMLDAVAVALRRDADLRAQLGALVDLRDRLATLSPRERQVMVQVVDGQMNKQIAFTLSISEITVKIHRGSVMRKMGARTVPALVKMSEILRRQA
jgi:FixJ family two-component response regulator